MMTAMRFWKSVGAVACLGVGLLAARMLWAQEGRFGPNTIPQLSLLERTRMNEQEKAKHTAWITEVLKQLQTIKPGQTRADLMKVCTTEGGLSTTTHRLYVYKDCPYIKVEVRFRPAGKAVKTEYPEEQPTDIITEISRPFLQWSIMD